MKGQFFVLGAILLASLFFIGLPITGQIIKPLSDDLNHFSDNLEKEFPNALNLALAAGDMGRLADFSNFVSSQLTQRNAEFANLWVVTEPDGGDVDITVGNFLGEDVTVVLNISDTIEMLYMPDGTVDSVTFFGVPGEFTLRVTFPEKDNYLDLQRDKINLYSFFTLSRDGDVIKSEVVA